MAIVPADLTYTNQVANLFAQGRKSYAIRYPFEASSLIKDQTSVLGIENGTLWGFLSIDCDDITLSSSKEKVQPVVPKTICRRIYLTHAAIAKGRSPYEDIAKLLFSALEQVPPLQVPSPQISPSSNINQAISLLIWYGDQRWLIAPLEKAGLTIKERIEFFALDRLEKRMLPPLNTPPLNVRLRPVREDDLVSLSQIDASVFTSIWHVTSEQLREMWITHRIFVAEVDQELAGYSAMAFTPNASMANGDIQGHLARLAVDERFKGIGLGRYLLLDALQSAQKRGATAVTLNTQTDNLPARQLYRSVGFSRTGNILPVMTKAISQSV